MTVKQAKEMLARFGVLTEVKDTAIHNWRTGVLIAEIKDGKVDAGIIRRYCFGH